MCRDAGLRYREILLWRTDCTMGNAAVMGLFPRIRYVLLSDLLLETMTDRQIEAVFAHELGHVVHRHLMWFGIYGIAALMFMSGPGEQMLAYLRAWYLRSHGQNSWDEIEGLVASVLGFGSFILAFGYLSPRFERQADVFAARTMQRAAEETGVVVAHADANPDNYVTAFEAHGLAKVPASEKSSGATEVLTPVPYRPGSYVGEYGAGVFASALHRVAIINHMPITARNWSHGSIAQRMRALREMSASPALTGRFDRVMTRLYAGLIACLCLFGVWWACLAMGQGEAAARPGAPVIGGTPTAVHAAGR
jgi:STE24 endopeptidase